MILLRRDRVVEIQSSVISMKVERPKETIEDRPLEVASNIPEPKDWLCSVSIYWTRGSLYWRTITTFATSWTGRGPPYVNHLFPNDSITSQNVEKQLPQSLATNSKMSFSRSRRCWQRWNPLIFEPSFSLPHCGEVSQDVARLSLHVGSFREAIPNLRTTSPWNYLAVFFSVSSQSK